MTDLEPSFALEPSLAIARINAIATAVPAQDVQQGYLAWACGQLRDPRKASVFARMIARGGIDHRHSVLSSADAGMGFGSFYNCGRSPGTAQRMQRYAAHAPALALQAIESLPGFAATAARPEAAGRITHLVLASCTGFMAPGLDQVIARHLGLASDVERIVIGFMGCYAGITLLRTARHIVRAQPEAQVLVVALELCTLHLQETEDLERLLAMAQFADGAGAALVSAHGPGLRLEEGLSYSLAHSEDLITWTIGDHGFEMALSGAVPGRLAEALEDEALQAVLGAGPGTPGLAYAVHPGGRSVLDAVERGLGLAPAALADSRAVLAEFGNMSSATVLFVLQRLMAHRPPAGLALAFGPGLAVEGLRFGWAD